MGIATVALKAMMAFVQILMMVTMTMLEQDDRRERLILLVLALEGH